MTSGKLKTLFLDAVPDDRLFDDPDTLAVYSIDTTENPPGRPELVIKLRTHEEAEAVVGIAAKHDVALTPRVAGTNLGGLSLAPRGGAILDLTEMNRILDINEVDMLAVVEPGVTFRQLVDELKARELPL